VYGEHPAVGKDNAAENDVKTQNMWKLAEIFNAGPSDERDHCCNEGHPQTNHNNIEVHPLPQR